jgi:NAD(P)-dependent dehydrogenase (short-subunit alcohol dehydrogenase family)
MESLQPEVTSFGISTTIVNPGFFRTDLLTQESATYATPSIADYAVRHAERVKWYESMNGQQAGDPAKLARPHHDRQPGRAAAPLHRRRGCHRHRRAEGDGPAGAGEFLPRPVDPLAREDA